MWRPNCACRDAKFIFSGLVSGLFRSAELHIDLDPNRPAKREFLKIKVPIQAAGAAHSVEHKCSVFATNNGRHTIVGEPLTVEREYAAAWKRTRLDLDELARLRFGEKWAVNRLQAHFGYSRTQIKKELRKLNPLNIPNIDIYH